MGKEITEKNCLEENLIRNLHEWIPERIKFYTAAKEAVLKNEQENLPAAIVQVENLDGMLSAYGEVFLMINGMYDCSFCAGKDSLCKDKENPKVCNLFKFSLENMAV